MAIILLDGISSNKKITFPKKWIIRGLKNRFLRRASLRFYNRFTFNEQKILQGIAKSRNRFRGRQLIPIRNAKKLHRENENCLSTDVKPSFKAVLDIFPAYIWKFKLYALNILPLARRNFVFNALTMKQCIRKKT